MTEKRLKCYSTMELVLMRKYELERENKRLKEENGQLKQENDELRYILKCIHNDTEAYQ